MKACVELNEDLENRILAGIRTGGFAHVAAAAWGVPPALLKRWLRLGKKAANPTYQAFAQKVAQAEATARLSAETRTHEKDARLWLRAGPGKERPGVAGWTTFVRPQVQSTSRVDLFASAVFLEFLATLRAELAAFPEANQAVTEVLSRSNHFD
jgi:hypothetical protein